MLLVCSCFLFHAIFQACFITVPYFFLLVCACFLKIRIAVRTLCYSFVVGFFGILLPAIRYLLYCNIVDNGWHVTTKRNIQANFFLFCEIDIIWLTPRFGANKGFWTNWCDFFLNNNSLNTFINFFLRKKNAHKCQTIIFTQNLIKLTREWISIEYFFLNEKLRSFRTFDE